MPKGGAGELYLYSDSVNFFGILDVTYSQNSVEILSEAHSDLKSRMKSVKFTESVLLKL